MDEKKVIVVKDLSGTTYISEVDALCEPEIGKFFTLEKAYQLVAEFMQDDQGRLVGVKTNFIPIDPSINDSIKCGLVVAFYFYPSSNSNLNKLYTSKKMESLGLVAPNGVLPFGRER